MVSQSLLRSQNSRRALAWWVLALSHTTISGAPPSCRRAEVSRSANSRARKPFFSPVRPRYVWVR